MEIWQIVVVALAAILGFIGGIVLHFTFLGKKCEGKFKGFAGWLQDFLTFKKLLIENLLKITYLILAIFITFASFATGAWWFPVALVGNLALRIAYEFSLILLIICRNTTEINKSLKKDSNESVK